MADSMQTPFVRHWLDKHDRFNLTMDEADKLQDLDGALRVLDLEDVEMALAVVDKVEEWGNGDDECSRGAGEERLLSDAPERSRDPLLRLRPHPHVPARAAPV
jgi:hypothetical protein